MKHRPAEYVDHRPAEPVKMEMNALADQLIPAPPFSLNLRGRLVEYTRPVVMGIVNLTADSFYGASRCAVGSQFTARIAPSSTRGNSLENSPPCR